MPTPNPFRESAQDRRAIALAGTWWAEADESERGDPECLRALSRATMADRDCLAERAGVRGIPSDATWSKMLDRLALMQECRKIARMEATARRTA